MSVVATPALSRGKQSMVRQTHHDVILSLSKDGSPPAVELCRLRHFANECRDILTDAYAPEVDAQRVMLCARSNRPRQPIDIMDDT